MSICSSRSAEKAIIKAIANGPAGSSDRPIVDCVLAGRPSSQHERTLVFQGIDDLEDRRIIFAKRDDVTNMPISIEKYDCSKAAGIVETIATPPKLTIVKPTLHITELVVRMHELLKREAGEDGRIRNGLTADQYVRKLHAEFSEEFDASYKQVSEAFSLLSSLELRGHAKSLHGVGMEVSSLTLGAQTESRETEVTELRREMARLEEENTGLLEENAALTQENGRLEQSVGDLRQRNDKLAAFRADVQNALEKSDKN